MAPRPITAVAVPGARFAAMRDLSSGRHSQDGAGATGSFRDGWTEQDVEVVIARGVPAELLYVPIVISMDPPDCGWAEGICMMFARHPHSNVRGNAILGFGHLARTCGQLNLEAVASVVLAALQDEDEYVRGQAQSAADDLLHFLGARVPGHAA